jgi:hypothetical protein
MPSELQSQQLYISTGGGSIGGSTVQLNPYGFNANSSGAGMFSNFSVGGSGTSGSDGNGGWNFYNYYINATPSNGENFLYDPNGWFGFAGAPLGSLYIGGTLYQNAYSDAKYKDNVTPIANALDKVNAIRGVEFDWNELAKEEQGRAGHEVGVIAQEVQAVYPFAVREVDKEREDHVTTALVVDHEKLIPLLLQSIKELSAEVNLLKQHINGANI